MESLYRKYRPLTFESVVGQQHIVSTLENAVTEGRLSHAYLFCGPRGTGKTTMARILAKSLLCRKAADAAPGQGCLPDGSCPECEAIAEGTHPDVYELDAASRTGVDNVREEIVNSVSFAPVRGKYKVYIIDEVHMLTTAAFNALLKTLEEPPGHVVFVLCTTDPQKVLETILSRCQRFDFHRISNEDIVGRLRFICEQEGFACDDEALEIVAKHARGGMRDALSTLEQLSVFGAGSVRASDAKQLLGETSGTVLSEFARGIAARDVVELFGLVRGQVDGGNDLMELTRDLVAHLRDVYTVRVAGERPGLVDGTPEELSALGEEAALFGGADRLARTLTVLDDAALEMRDATDARLVLEIALTRLARPEADLTLEALAERIDRLEAQLAAGVPSAPMDVTKLAAPAGQRPVSAPNPHPEQQVASAMNPHPEQLAAPGEQSGAVAPAAKSAQQFAASNGQVASAPNTRSAQRSVPVPNPHPEQQPAPTLNPHPEQLAAPGGQSGAQQLTALSGQSGAQHLADSGGRSGAQQQPAPTGQSGAGHPAAPAGQSGAVGPAARGERPGVERPAAPVGQPVAQRQAVPNGRSDAQRRPASDGQSGSAASAATSPQPSAPTTDPGDLQRKWSEVIKRVTAAQASRGALLQSSHAESDDGERLVVGLPVGSGFAIKMLGRPDSHELIVPIVCSVFGNRTVEYVMGGVKAPAPAPKPRVGQPAAPAMSPRPEQQTAPGGQSDGAAPGPEPSQRPTVPVPDHASGPTIVPEPDVDAQREAWESEQVPYDDATIASYVDEEPPAPNPYPEQSAAAPNPRPMQQAVPVPGLRSAQQPASAPNPHPEQQPAPTLNPHPEQLAAPGGRPGSQQPAAPDEQAGAAALAAASPQPAGGVALPWAGAATALDDDIPQTEQDAKAMVADIFGAATIFKSS